MPRKRKLSSYFKKSEWNRFLGEFQSESDRSSAIIGAAWLDELLGQLISSFLVDDEEAVNDLLQHSYAPLGSFASRISVAYCMGLISEIEKHDLKVVKDIRNSFAHSLPGLSFESQEIKDICLNFQYPDTVADYEDYPIGSSSRTLFVFGVATLANILEHRRKRIRNRREVASTFYTYFSDQPPTT